MHGSVVRVQWLIFIFGKRVDYQAKLAKIDKIEVIF